MGALVNILLPCACPVIFSMPRFGFNCVQLPLPPWDLVWRGIIVSRSLTWFLLLLARASCYSEMQICGVESVWSLAADQVSLLFRELARGFSFLELPRRVPRHLGGGEEADPGGPDDGGVVCGHHGCVWRHGRW